MFNIGGPEFVVIMIVALVVLGPTRLPGALREVGRLMGEAKKLSANFQNEVNEAMADPVKKVTGVEGPDLSKLPRSSRDLVGFAVPEPFAKMEKKEEEPEAETTPALDPHSPEANGMAPEPTVDTVDTVDTESAAHTESAADAGAPVTGATVANAAAANVAATKNVEPAVLPSSQTAPSPKAAPTGKTPQGNAHRDDAAEDDVPMFGDR